MESLSLSIQMACKTISNLIHRNGINQLSTPPADIRAVKKYNKQRKNKNPNNNSDMRMNSMKRLDQLSTNVLRNALRFTGKMQMVKPAKDVNEETGIEEGPDEHQPGVLITSALDSKYVACFDPLDGSGNADAAICTGTVFGIFETGGEEQQNGNELTNGDVVDDLSDGRVKSDNLMVNAVLQPVRKMCYVFKL